MENFGNNTTGPFLMSDPAVELLTFSTRLAGQPDPTCKLFPTPDPWITLLQTLFITKLHYNDGVSDDVFG